MVLVFGVSLSSGGMVGVVVGVLELVVGDVGVDVVGVVGLVVGWVGVVGGVGVVGWVGVVDLVVGCLEGVVV